MEKPERRFIENIVIHLLDIEFELRKFVRAWEGVSPSELVEINQAIGQIKSANTWLKKFDSTHKHL